MFQIWNYSISALSFTESHKWGVLRGVISLSLVIIAFQGSFISVLMSAPSIVDNRFFSSIDAVCDDEDGGKTRWWLIQWLKTRSEKWSDYNVYNSRGFPQPERVISCQVRMTVREYQEPFVLTSYADFTFSLYLFCFVKMFGEELKTIRRLGVRYVRQRLSVLKPVHEVIILVKWMSGFAASTQFCVCHCLRTYDMEGPWLNMQYRISNCCGIKVRQLFFIGDIITRNVQLPGFWKYLVDQWNLHFIEATSCFLRIHTSNDIKQEILPYTKYQMVTFL